MLLPIPSSTIPIQRCHFLENDLYLLPHSLSSLILYTSWYTEEWTHSIYTGYTTALYIILFIILYSNSFQPLADIKTFMAYDCNLAIWNCITIKIEWKNCLTCTSKIKEAFTELFGIINCYSSSPETSNLFILQVNPSTDWEICTWNGVAASGQQL